MAKFTQADVEYLIAAKKYICRTVEDNTRNNPMPHELRITYEIRRADRRVEDIGLRFRALKEPNSVLPKWGIALMWHNERIRGIDFKFREDLFNGGLIIGSVKGWHEHVWTDLDRDGNIIPAAVKNEDKRALIELCMTRWNIEGYFHQYTLEAQYE